MTTTLAIHITALLLLANQAAQAETLAEVCPPARQAHLPPPVQTIRSGPDGSSIRALADGVVVFSDYLSGSYALIVNYGDHCLVAYRDKMHQYKQVADYVKTGEVIAIWGDE